MAVFDTPVSSFAQAQYRIIIWSGYFRFETSWHGCRSCQTLCLRSGRSRFGQASSMLYQRWAIFLGRALRFGIVARGTSKCRVPWRLVSMCNRIGEIQTGSACPISIYLSLGHSQESCKLCQAPRYNGHQGKSHCLGRSKARSKWLTGSCIPTISLATRKYDP